MQSKIARHSNKILVLHVATTQPLYFKVNVEDCSPQISGLHLAMLTLIPTIKI